MAPIQLSSDEAQQRFGVGVPIDHFAAGKLSRDEEANVKTVLQYMAIAYSPDKASGRAVKPLCALGNTFSAPSTFPAAHTGEEYADAHQQVMTALCDLHIVRFDVIIAQEDFVSLRYTATGSHIGEAHNGIEPTGRKAEWTAAGNFILDEQNRIAHWWKDWDKMQMWKQLGWVKPDNDAVEFA